MSSGAIALIFYSIFILFYFAAINISYLCLVIIAFFELRQVAIREKIVDRDRSFRSGFFKPISIIIPAFNEEATIVETVRSTLALRYPDFEVIVVNDGSTDSTFAMLAGAFTLQESVRDFRADLPTARIRKIYTSAYYPNLVIVDKENGGKSDALNAGINLAQFPLFCNIDSDTIIDVEALLKVTDIFVKDWRVVAAGGTIRAANGMRIEGGMVKEIRLAESFWVRFQIVEYLRAFLFGRAGWSSIGGLLILSGAFSVFRRNAVVQAGGYLTNTIGEDMELVLRLQRTMKSAKRPYRVVFLPDPVCWTQVPEDYRGLKTQRRRWQRGLCESLILNFSIFLNPQYGTVGMISFPFFLFFEFLGPIIELSGYLVLIFVLATGLLNPSFALIFLAVAVVLGILLSTASLLMEEIFYRSYKNLREVLILFLFAVMENFFYRQIHSWWRFLGFIDFIFKRGGWGVQTRKSFNQGNE
jgi:cellulose synthase/poly-beta-1,6-N-acetylglucosamine synthase-like glycosyltransferase